MKTLQLKGMQMLTKNEMKKVNGGDAWTCTCYDGTRYTIYVNNEADFIVLCREYCSDTGN